MLEGKLVNLPKPLAIMNRVPPDTGPDAAHEDELSSKTTPPTWKIHAIVKRKMVFAKRPMPMVGKTNTSTGLAKT